MWEPRVQNGFQAVLGSKSFLWAEDPGREVGRQVISEGNWTQSFRGPQGAGKRPPTGTRARRVTRSPLCEEAVPRARILALGQAQSGGQRKPWVQSRGSRRQREAGVEERRAGCARRAGRAGIVRAWGRAGEARGEPAARVRPRGSVQSGWTAERFSSTGGRRMRKRHGEARTRETGGKPGAGGVLDTQCEAVTKKVPALRFVCRLPCGGR